MKSKILFVLIALLDILPLTAQYNEYLSTVIPPSPTSAVFRQYGNHQPSLSSGTINIPILLFEIKADNFTLPFTLQYNTSGINVMDRPYPSGYGWVFSPGLRITRTMFGRPDDTFPMKQLTGHEEYASLKPGIIDYQYYRTHGLNQDDLFDTQQDIFTLHLPAGNYTFLIKKVGSTYQAITIGNFFKVEFYISQAQICGFQVTDENGVVYKFGMYENETIINNYIEYINGSISVTTAWMLREVILPNNSKINFKWKSFLHNNVYSAEAALSIGIKDYKNWSCAGDPNPEVTDEGGSIAFCTYGEISMLEKIEYPAGEINISYKGNNNPFMTKFEVKDKNGLIRKDIGFIYGEGNYQEEALLKFLKIGQEIYRFTYNDHRYFKNSTGLDYWGYYNGKSNYTLIPKMTLKLFDVYAVFHPLTPNAVLEIGHADRSVDAELMQAFMLKRIDYPTGGYSEFEYEPHQFENKYVESTDAFAIIPGPINKGGGLRVSKIISKEKADAVPIIKTYKYGINEDGMANVSCVPTLDTFIDELWFFHELSESCYLNFNIETSRNLSINAFSNYSKYYIRPNPIWYSTVTEYINDNKIAYGFSNAYDQCEYITSFKLIKRPYLTSYRGLFNNGPRMTCQTEYKKSGQAYTPVKQTIFDYDYISHPDMEYSYIQNSIIDRIAINTSSTLGDGPDFNNQNLTLIANVDYQTISYLHKLYYLDVSYFRLKNKQETILIDDSNSITTTEEYVYDLENQIQKINKTSSETSKKQVVEYKYPYYYTDVVYVDMVNKNMIAPVVEEIRYGGVDGALETGRIKTNYTNTQSITTGLIRRSSIQSSTSGTSGLRTEVSFDKYDTHGNLLQATLPDGTSVSYLWSYNWQYPVAEVKNAAFSQVNTALSAIGLTSAESLSAITYPDDNVISKLKSLKDQLPQAFVSIYRYLPLIGMTEFTNPRGLTEFYNYDNYGRLSTVKDNNAKSISDYSYDYTGPTVPMQIDVPSAASYNMSSSNSIQSFSATVTNNIGSLTYDWYLRNSSGVVLSSATDRNVNTYTVTLNTPGTMTLTCIAKDNFTGKTVQTVKTFNVNLATEFLNIQKTETSYRRAYADIYLVNAGTIRFHVNANAQTNVKVWIKLPTKNAIEITDNSVSFDQEVSCFQGWTSVDISIEGDDPNHPSASADVSIESVSGGNSMGGNRLLYLWP
ncbi:MAG: hypothetical protein LBU84_01185 [Prevotella sp.]|jgi:hypothetical protein|nr:hypothetical protein [Prevotella sp.]